MISGKEDVMRVVREFLVSDDLCLLGNITAIAFFIISAILILCFGKLFAIGFAVVQLVFYAIAKLRY